MELFNKFTFLDGGFGTMLVAKGLKAGQLPEEYNIEKPEIVQEIHKAYIDAGSDIILTNTFGANKKKMSRSKYPLSELICSAVLNAKKAAEGTDVKIALDLGPIGELIEPMGMMTFEEAVDVFKESISLGVENGVDLIYFETMSDLYELKAAIIAAKECCDKPIFSTMTFEQSMRTFMGCSIPSMAVLLESMGVSALGINCSLGPKEMLPIVKELIKYTNLPLIVKPNAGLPEMVDGKATYSITPKEFSDLMIEYAKLGINIFGGCCGTSPDYIRKTKEKISVLSPVTREKKSFTAVCSPSNTVIIDKVTVIGEKINPTGNEDLQKAILEEDIDSIVDLGYDQMDCDAKILDVNLGLYGIDEAYIMTETVKALQTAVNLPLQIDSADPEVIEAGIRIYNGKPIINSVNGKDECLDKILPLAKKYGACVIGLTMDENGIPEKWEDRVAIAEKIIKKCIFYGIAKENIIIDCLALCSAVASEEETLKAVNAVSKMGYKTILGISNVSFGLPDRSEINQKFLKKAIQNGLDMAILNPEDDALMEIVSDNF